MKMNSAQIEQTLDQFEGKLVPEDSPALPQLKQIFGDHRAGAGGLRNQGSSQL